MKRPSVLFINRVYPPGRGASGRVLRDLARGFSRDGWHVHVLTTGAKGGHSRDGTIKVTRIRARDQLRFEIAYVWIWFRLAVMAVFMPRVDLVVTMTDPPFTSLIGRAIARMRGTKHIHWCQDLYPDLLPVMGVKLPAFLQGFLQRLSRRTMQNSDKTIVIGRCMARHLSYTGVDPKKITVIPNWPDTELIKPGRKHTEFLQNAQALKGLPGSKSYEEQLKHGPKFRVLYAGTLGRAHPYEAILGAAEILAQDHPEIEFVFVGDGKGFNALAAERSRRALENVRLLPFQPNSGLKDVMESGDVHLVSMKEDAAGLLVPCKLYSALAVGRPCIFIGPEMSEITKVLSDFKAGILVRQGDAQALAAAILQLRMSGEVWFSAHEGAMKAGEVFVPRDAIDAWISRARSVVVVSRNAGRGGRGGFVKGSGTGGSGTGSRDGDGGRVKPRGYAPPRDDDYADSATDIDGISEYGLTPDAPVQAQVQYPSEYYDPRDAQNAALTEDMSMQDVPLQSAPSQGAEQPQQASGSMPHSDGAAVEYTIDHQSAVQGEHYDTHEQRDMRLFDAGITNPRRAAS